MNLNENSLDLGSCTNPNHNHNPAISKAIHAHHIVGTRPVLLREIDASAYEVQRRTKRNIAYKIQAAKGRAEFTYQRVQLR